jgi:putative transposase
MATDEILSRFGKRMSTARKEYVSYVSAGMEQGDRLDLTGGGLVRSYGGWQQIKLAAETGVFLKSDERILGDSHFVDAVLGAAEERLERRDDYARQGIDLDTLVRIVAKLLEMEINDILVGGKQPKRVRARSLLCFWAVRELGLTGTNLAGTLHLTQPAVSIAVQRGERLAREYGWRLETLVRGNL